MQEQAYLQAVHEEEEASCSWVLEAADTYCANRLTVGSGMSAEQCGEAVLRQSPTPYPATDPVSRQVVMQVRPASRTQRSATPRVLTAIAVLLSSRSGNRLLFPVPPSRAGRAAWATRSRPNAPPSSASPNRRPSYAYTPPTPPTTHTPLPRLADTCGGPCRVVVGSSAH